jgi:peptide/nickel transport system ATP-binding protein
VTSGTLLSLEDVSVELPTERGNLLAVAGVDLTLTCGRTLAIAGESGSGKTMLSRAILQLLPRQARCRGRVLFDGEDLTKLAPRALRRLRGKSIAAVFQDPMTSLNPVLTIGEQISETLKQHLGFRSAAARRRSIELLAAVGIASPELRIRQYPHQLSGGMRQRVVVAMALSCEPKLLIADEPTTALDVTVQSQILDLLAREQRRRQMAMILISHDLSVLAGRTDEIAVMYAGCIVERAPTPLLFADPRMPYTRALMAAIPRIEAAPHAALQTIPGRPPDLARRRPGCAFAPRCWNAAGGRCYEQAPALSAPDRNLRQYACWRPLITDTPEPGAVKPAS